MKSPPCPSRQTTWPSPGPVAVVDLDHPVLVADGQDQVSVRGRQAHGVVRAANRPPGRSGTTDVGPGAGLDSDLAQDRPAVDIQVVEGIPGPGHLEVLVEHQDQLTDVIGGSAVDVDGALRDTRARPCPRRATAAPRGGSRRLISCPRAVSCAFTAARFVSRTGLPARSISRRTFAVVPDRVAVVAHADHRAPRQQGRAAHVGDPQARLLGVVIPLHATREVGGDRVRDAVASQGRCRRVSGRPCPGPRSLPGPGGWLTVKVGKVNVEGRAPVVKSRGAEPVPSLSTCRIW